MIFFFFFFFCSAQRANREHHFNVTRKRHAAIATFFETVVADARIISRFSEEVKPACCFSELILGGCCKWNIKKLRQGYPELKMQTAGQEHPSPLQSRTLCVPALFCHYVKPLGSTLDISHSPFSAGSNQHAGILTWARGL